jgi:hypothetical protein
MIYYDTNTNSEPLIFEVDLLKTFNKSFTKIK